MKSILLNYGYSCEMANQSDTSEPTIFLNEKEKIVGIIQALEFVGYTKEQIIDMTSSDLHNFGYNKEELNNIYKVFETLKEDKEDQKNSSDIKLSRAEDFSVISDEEYQRRISSILNELTQQQKELKQYALRKK